MELDLPDVDGLEVACDTESSGLYPDDRAWGSQFRCSLSVVSLAWRHPGGDLQTLAFPFDQEQYNAKQNNGDRPMLWGDGEYGPDPNLGEGEWKELLGWLGRQRLIFQKGKHDLHFLRVGTRDWAGTDLDYAVYWDTLLASRLLEPGKPAGLDAIGKRHFGRGKDDEELYRLIDTKKGRYGTRNHPRLDLVPWRVMRSYAEWDAGLTYLAYEWQRTEFDKRPELVPYFEQEMTLLPILYRMERAGVEFDRQAALAAVVELQRRMELLAVDLEFDPTPDAAAAWFFDKMKAPPHCKTAKKGRASVKECCLRSLAEYGVSAVADQAVQLTRWTKLHSAVSKYYLGWTDQLGGDGQLRTDLDQAGTISLRFSSKRVNLQAVPNEYRHAEHVGGVILPRHLLFPPERMAAQGQVVFEFDLEQAELRMATAYSGCKLMRELLESGADVHGETAERLFGSRDKERRQTAKRANFAMIYDVSWRTFQEDVEKQIGLILSDDEAQAVHGGWRRLYPEFHAINDRASRLAVNRRWVLLWNGRRRYFTDFELQYKPYKAFNQVIQGGIAEIVKQWMVEVDRRYPGVLRLQVHDSLVCVLPVDQADAMSSWIVRAGARIATEAAGIEMAVSAKPWRE
jgi:DNA polymerase-1